MKQPRWLLAACVLWCLPLACAKRSQTAASVSASSEPAAPQAAVEDAARSEPASIRTPPAVRSSTPAPSPQPAPPPATPATSAELLQSDRPAPVPARDFKIGPLQVARAAPGGAGEAAAVLVRFLDGLTRGEVVPELLDAAVSERLTRTVSYYTGGGMLPVRYRIGRLAQTADGFVVANVRLFGAVGVTEGEIYLLRGESGFTVSDVQVGFSLLAESYVPPEEPYIPSSYEYRAGASGTDGE